MTIAEPNGAEAPRKMSHVLIVEDELDQQELLRFNFKREGFEVTAADDGPKALELARRAPPDAVVLDLMLPGMDGVDVCRTLRSESATAAVPVVMLTAKTEDADVVAGLDAGADDYVTKPYSPRVLLARVNAVLRHKPAANGAEAAPSESVIRHQDLVIRPERFEVTVGGAVVKLSSTEFRILSLLAGRPGYVFSREQIIRQVHGTNCAVTNRSVDVHVFWLRQKLGPRGRAIQAVRGVGYRFRDPAK
jgi:two-component system phosphate regulon response regulator PhoB